jgi:hypothetical protein
MSARSRARAEDGLVGKLLILWLVMAAVLVVAAVDAGTILLARYRAADAAQNASFDAAGAYHTSKSERAALQAAKASVAASDADARLASFELDPRTGDVTVTVTQHVSTLVAGRFGFTQAFTHVTATDTSEAPPP